MEIILYTIDCPKCKVLEKKLELAGVSYVSERDIEKMKAIGLKSAPMLSIDGELKNYTDSIAWLKGQN